MKFNTYNFSEITINCDSKRIPLSSAVREKRQGQYRYYGAQGVIDYIDDYIFDGEYLLIAEDGENLKSKKQNIAQLVSGQFWVNNHAHIVQGNDESDLKYLYYAFNNTDISGYITGSAQPKLSQSSLNAIVFQLPSRPEQKAIAAVLSALDNKIKLNNKINKTLEELAQAIFKSWFVDFEPFQDGEFVESELGMIPDGWRVGTLGEVITFSNGYAFKSSDLLDAPTTDCFHVFKMGHIKKGGGLNPEGTKSWVKRENCVTLNKFVLIKGDLLMCMTDMKGNVALLGHTALLYEDDKYIVNQRVGVLRKNNEIGIDYPFLYILTNHRKFIEDLRGRANSGVQVNLSTNEIKSSLFVIPSTLINEKFDAYTKPMFEQIFANNLENQKLAQLRDTLLPKLMSGEIRVPVEVE